MKTANKRPSRRNAIASTLAQACFRKQIVKPEKGRGSYRRQPKHRLAGGGRRGAGPTRDSKAA